MQKNITIVIITIIALFSIACGGVTEESYQLRAYGCHEWMEEPMHAAVNDSGADAELVFVDSAPIDIRCESIELPSDDEALFRVVTYPMPRPQSSSVYNQTYEGLESLGIAY